MSRRFHPCVRKGFRMSRSQPAPSVLYRLTDVYIGLLLTLFLLLPGTGGYAAITEAKFHFFLALTGLYAAAMLVLIAELWLIGRWRPPSLPALWGAACVSHRAILLFWLWSALSTLFAVDRQTAFWGSGRLDGFLTLSLYCLLFFLVSAFGRPAGWQLWAMGLSACLCCVVAIVQLAGGNPLSLYPEGMNYYDGFVRYAGQFLGTVGNVDLVAAVLCMAIPLCWVGLWRLNSPRRFLLILPLVLCLAVSFASRVEAGFVGIFGTLLLAVPATAPLPKEKRIRLALGSGLVILLALVVIYLFGSHLPGFLYELSELLHGRWDDRFGSSRLYIWRGVLPLIGERPLLGGGPDTLGLRCDLLFERYSQTLGLMITSSVDNAHNEYLNLAVNQGVPALALYLTALLSAAVRWVKAAPSSPASALLGSAVLGYCIQAFFGLSSVITTPYLWLAFALLLSAQRTQPTLQHTTPKRRNHK